MDMKKSIKKHETNDKTHEIKENKMNDKHVNNWVTTGGRLWEPHSKHA